jgi:hypothetical protein
LQILKNQADMKNLADFEKSGGHESLAAARPGQWKIMQKRKKWLGQTKMKLK